MDLNQITAYKKKAFDFSAYNKKIIADNIFFSEFCASIEF